MDDTWRAMIEAAKAEHDLAKPFRGGKKYTTVAVRNEIARRHLGELIGTETEIVHYGADKGALIVVRATIRRTSDSVVLATGHAEEIRGQGQVNSTSALENAETSAIGRALASLGLSGGEFASANEMEGVERKEEAKSTTEARVEPSHDPQTGEIQSNGNAAQAAAHGLQSAWEDGVLDKLPKNANPREKAEAFANQIIADFDNYKTMRGLRGYCSGKNKYFIRFETTYPDIAARVQEAFDRAEVRINGDDPIVLGDVQVTDDAGRPV